MGHFIGGQVTDALPEASRSRNGGKLLAFDEGGTVGCPIMCLRVLLELDTSKSWEFYS